MPSQKTDKMEQIISPTARFFFLQSAETADQKQRKKPVKTIGIKRQIEDSYPSINYYICKSFNIV